MSELRIENLFHRRQGVFVKSACLTVFASKLAKFPAQVNESVGRAKVFESSMIDSNFTSIYSNPQSKVVGLKSTGKFKRPNSVLHSTQLNNNLSSTIEINAENKSEQNELEREKEVEIGITLLCGASECIPFSLLISSQQRPQSSLGSNKYNQFDTPKKIQNPEIRRKSHLSSQGISLNNSESGKLMEQYNNQTIELSSGSYSKDYSQSFIRPRARSQFSSAQGNYLFEGNIKSNLNEASQSISITSHRRLLSPQKNYQDSRQLEAKNSLPKGDKASQTQDFGRSKEGSKDQKVKSSIGNYKRTFITNPIISFSRSKRNQPHQNQSLQKTDKKNENPEVIKSTEDDSVVEDQTNEILDICQKKLSFSIQMVKDSMEQVKGIQSELKGQVERYEAEGDKKMVELFQGFFPPNDMIGDKWSTLNSKEKQNQSRAEVSCEESPVFDRKLSTFSKQSPSPKKGSKKLLKQEDILKVDPIKVVIQECLMKVTRQLDSQQEDDSKADTLDIEQTQMINRIQLEANDVGLKKVSLIHQLMSLILPAHGVIQVDLLFANFETLPFDYSFVESQPKKFLIGSGTFGKVYKVQLKPIKDRSHPALPLLSKVPDEPENEHVVVKVTRFNDIDELQFKVKEFLIENYLLQKQFRHFCRPYAPAYFIQREEHQFELLCFKELGDYTLNQLLQKRQEKFLNYNEHELLHVFRGFLFLIKELHDRQIAHRDIKPNNFVYSKQNRSWKIIDFGVSMLEANLKETKEYVVCGSPLYMIPRLADLRIQSSTRESKVKAKMCLKSNDLYSLGITLLRIKKLIVTPFDSRYIKSVLASDAFQEDNELSNVVIKELTQKDESLRTELNLQDLIAKIDGFLSTVKTPSPNDQAIMNDQFEDITYNKINLSEDDFFEKALCLKRTNQFDQALKILIKLTDGPKSTKLKINSLTLMSQIFQKKGKFDASLKHLEQALIAIGQIYPKNSLKFGEIYEELGNVLCLLNRREESQAYYQQAFHIYQLKPLECKYRTGKLAFRLKEQGIQINMQPNSQVKNRKRDASLIGGQPLRVSILEG